MLTKLHVCLSLMFIALCSASFLLAGAQRKSLSSLNELTSNLESATTDQDPIEISVTLNSNGFDPPQITPAARKFLLSLDNRSGVSDLVLRLIRSDGSQVREMRVAGVGGDWSELFDLAEGAYTLTEANHSNWTCSIVIH